MSEFILRVPEHPPVEDDDLDKLTKLGKKLAADTAEEWRKSKGHGHHNCQWTIQASARCAEADMGVVARGIVNPDRKSVVIKRGAKKDEVELVDDVPKK